MIDKEKLANWLDKQADRDFKKYEENVSESYFHFGRWSAITDTICMLEEGYFGIGEDKKND